MELVVLGDEKHSGKLTREHLKEVIKRVSEILEGGHKISDVRFEIPKDRQTAIILVYDVPKNLVIKYEPKGEDDVEPDSLGENDS